MGVQAPQPNPSLLRQLTKGVDEAQLARTAKMTLPQIAVLVAHTRGVELLEQIINCDNADGGEDVHTEFPDDAIGMIHSGVAEFTKRLSTRGGLSH